MKSNLIGLSVSRFRSVDTTEMKEGRRITTGRVGLRRDRCTLFFWHVLKHVETNCTKKKKTSWRKLYYNIEDANYFVSSMWSITRIVLSFITKIKKTRERPRSPCQTHHPAKPFQEHDKVSLKKANRFTTSVLRSVVTVRINYNFCIYVTIDCIVQCGFESRLNE